MANIERVKTGVPGFDELIEGGIPTGFNVIFTGGPGTGKTIFGLQYIYNGAINGENGVYVSLETSTDGIKNQAMQFGWDLDKLEKEGKILILRIPMDVIKLDLFSAINEAIKKVNAKRLVFDSLDALAINIDMFTIPVAYVGSRNRITYTGKSRRRITYLVMNELSKLKTTNIVITASSQDDKQITIDGVSEYASDGVVAMYNTLIGAKHAKTLTILKLRETNNSPYIHDVEFGNAGINIKAVEAVYKE